MDIETKTILQKVLDDLEEIKKTICVQSDETKVTEELVDSEEICRLMKLSKKSLARYRSMGYIPFYRVKGKIYYLISEVRKALKNHYYGS